MKYGPIEYYSILKQKEKMIRTPRYLINFKKQIGRLYLLLVWRRKRQPTPVFLPRESHGQGSLAGTVRESKRVRHCWLSSSSFIICHQLVEKEKKRIHIYFVNMIILVIRREGKQMKRLFTLYFFITLILSLVNIVQFSTYSKYNNEKPKNEVLISSNIRKASISDKN